MITPNDCITKYGLPTPEFEKKWMGVFEFPDDLYNNIEPLPMKIYCNVEFFTPLCNALYDVLNNNLQGLLTEYCGCFNIRLMRGGNVYSIHSWGIAIDFNCSTNVLGQEPQMDSRIVECFKNNGFDWGGDWQRKDGMHFQLKEI